MSLNAIVACNLLNYIGKDNALMWRIPDDLKRFRQLTDGHTVVMGRKTYHSLRPPTGRLLPNRYNIIMTKTQDLDIIHPVSAPVRGYELVESIKPVLERARTDEVFVIGGGQIYELFTPYYDKIYMTMVYNDLKGDVKFPWLGINDYQCIDIKYHNKTEEDDYDYAFWDYVRINRNGMTSEQEMDGAITAVADKMLTEWREEDQQV